MQLFALLPLRFVFIVHSRYCTVGWSIACIYVQSAEVNMASQVVYIGYGLVHCAIHNTYTAHAVCYTVELRGVVETVCNQRVECTVSIIE